MLGLFSGKKSKRSLIFKMACPLLPGFPYFPIASNHLGGRFCPNLRGLSRGPTQKLWGKFSMMWWGGKGAFEHLKLCKQPIKNSPPKRTKVSFFGELIPITFNSETISRNLSKTFTTQHWVYIGSLKKKIPILIFIYIMHYLRDNLNRRSSLISYVTYLSGPLIPSVGCIYYY